MNELIKLIRDWANARNIINGATSLSQFAKLQSEFGELGDNLHAGSDPTVEINKREILEKIADDIGDQFVVLTIIAAQEGINLEDLLASDTLPFSEVAFGEFLLLSRVYGKIGDAILKRDIESIKEQISLAVLLLWNLALEYAEADLLFCVAAAYGDIKDRRGVMYNGTFVKSTDARYPDILKELGLPNEN